MLLVPPEYLPPSRYANYTAFCCMYMRQQYGRAAGTVERGQLTEEGLNMFMAYNYRVNALWRAVWWRSQLCSCLGAMLQTASQRLPPRTSFKESAPWHMWLPRLDNNISILTKYI